MKKILHSVELQELLKYRSGLMGISILWIMLFHSHLKFDFILFDKLKWIGYGGVDIFLLCSGIGCYYSLSANSDLYCFFRKRIKRILPTWGIVMLFWIPIAIFIKKIPAQALLGNLLCIQSLTGLSNSFNWYISFLWVFYLLAPYLFAIIQNSGKHKAKFVLAALIVVSIPFWTNSDLIIGVSRLPIFYIGMLVGKYAKQGKVFHLREIIISVILMILGVVILLLSYSKFRYLLDDYALHWYPFILITPGLCLCVTLIFEMINCNIFKKIIEVLNWFGDYSFEIYLVHIVLFDLLNIGIERSLIKQSNLIWWLAFAVVFVLSIILRKLVQFGLRTT